MPRNEHYGEADQNVIDVLGFNPYTGKRATGRTPQSIDNANTNQKVIPGFDSDEYTLPRLESDILGHPEFDEYFTMTVLRDSIIFGKPCRTVPFALLSVVDDNFKNVTRRYHHINPTIPFNKQRFPIKNFAVFEKLGLWGANKPPSNFRLLRIGHTNFERLSQQSVEFSSDGEVSLSINNPEWGNVSFMYKDGKLISGKTSNHDFLIQKDFSNEKSRLCTLTGPTKNILIPNYLTHPLPTELLIDDIAVEQNPFGTPTHADTWKDKDITDIFGVTVSDLRENTFPLNEA